MSEAEKRNSSVREMPEADRKTVRNLTVFGLVMNIALTAVKFAAGIIAGSQAVVADAVHSLSDVTTDVAILVGVRYWSRPADECHPYGHRRIETIITAGIGLALAGVAAGIAYNSLSTIHENHKSVPGWSAFWAAIASIVLKEFLYRITAAGGRRIKSSAMVANAWHHRSDAFSSIPAAAAVAGAAIGGPEWGFLDHVGAVVVSLLILQAAWVIVAPTLAELIDSAAPREKIEAIKSLALAVPGVLDVHEVRTRYIGPGLQVNLHVLVDGEMSVTESHRIAGAVKGALLRDGPDVLDVCVHIEPVGSPPPAPGGGCAAA